MTTYKINPDEIPRAMPEIFGGPAARWFRTSHLQSASWETFRREFLDFFLPPRNLKRLEDEIRTHMQRKGESFKTYLIELRTKVQQAGHREEERKHGSRVSAVYQARRIRVIEAADTTEYESVKQHELIRCGAPRLTAGNREGSQLRRSPNFFRSSESTTQARQVTHRMVEQGTDAYPVPRINHILEMLRHARYISTLDLKNGYWQIPMARDTRQYTAFTVSGRGLYQWKVMPFGLHSASSG